MSSWFLFGPGQIDLLNMHVTRCMSRSCTRVDSGSYDLEPVCEDLPLWIVPVLEWSIDKGGDPAEWRPYGHPVTVSV